jgi:DNA polymerase III subunit chi
MTEINFYSLAPDSRGEQLLLACRLVERIWATKLRILIYCPEQVVAQSLNRLLWTFRQDSFLPHGFYNRVDPVWTPVLISSDGRPETECQVLINLSSEIPSFVDRFARVCEIIDNDSLNIHAGRERFRRYRERGYSLVHHSIQL